MKWTLAPILIVVLCTAAHGADLFSGGTPPGSGRGGVDFQDGWEDAGEDWADEPPPLPGKDLVVEDKPVKIDEEAASGPKKEAAFALQSRVGGVIPFLSSEVAYSAGFGFGVAGKIDLADMYYPGWIRPSVDLGFISAEEDTWDGDSILTLLHLDIGSDFIRTGDFQLQGYLCLGVGVEIFSGQELGPAGMEDLSEVNANFLGGGGLAFGFSPADNFDLTIDARLTFPLGSQNVRGLVLVGLCATFHF